MPDQCGKQLCVVHGFRREAELFDVDPPKPVLLWIWGVVPKVGEGASLVSEPVVHGAGLEGRQGDPCRTIGQAPGRATG